VSLLFASSSHVCVLAGKQMYVPSSPYSVPREQLLRSKVERAKSLILLSGWNGCWLCNALVVGCVCVYVFGASGFSSQLNPSPRLMYVQRLLPTLHSLRRHMFTIFHSHLTFDLGKLTWASTFSGWESLFLQHSPAQLIWVLMLALHNL